jgi:hypothetical protein
VDLAVLLAKQAQMLEFYHLGNRLDKEVHRDLPGASTQILLLPHQRALNHLKELVSPSNTVIPLLIFLQVWGTIQELWKNMPQELQGWLSLVHLLLQILNPALLALIPIKFPDPYLGLHRLTLRLAVMVKQTFLRLLRPTSLSRTLATAAHD